MLTGTSACFLAAGATATSVGAGALVSASSVVSMDIGSVLSTGVNSDLASKGRMLRILPPNLAIRRIS